MVGKKRFDKRGTVGTHHYEHVKHTEDWLSLFMNLRDQGYRIVGVDNVPEARNVAYAPMEKLTAFVFGEEQLGLSEHMLDNVDEILYIKQGGSVRSINVAVAAGIVMSHYYTSWG